MKAKNGWAGENLNLEKPNGGAVVDKKFRKKWGDKWSQATSWNWKSNQLINGERERSILSKR